MIYKRWIKQLGRLQRSRCREMAKEYQLLLQLSHLQSLFYFKCLQFCHPFDQLDKVTDDVVKTRYIILIKEKKKKDFRWEVKGHISSKYHKLPHL